MVLEIDIEKELNLALAEVSLGRKEPTVERLPAEPPDGGKHLGTVAVLAPGSAAPTHYAGVLSLCIRQRSWMGRATTRELQGFGFQQLRQEGRFELCMAFYAI